MALRARGCLRAALRARKSCAALGRSDVMYGSDAEPWQGCGGGRGGGCCRSLIKLYWTRGPRGPCEVDMKWFQEFYGSANHRLAHTARLRQSQAWKFQLRQPGILGGKGGRVKAKYSYTATQRGT